jgi:hypothetical protein
MVNKSDADFHKIFETISKIVDFSGCKTPDDINQRLQAKAKQLQSESPSPATDDTENRGVE